MARTRSQHALKKESKKRQILKKKEKRIITVLWFASLFEWKEGSAGDV